MKLLTAGFALSLATAAFAAEPMLSDGPEVSAADVAQVLDDACLAAMPDFDASDDALDRYGFRTLDTVIDRPHATKPMRAMVSSRPQPDGGRGGSCMVLAEGPTLAESAPLVAGLVETHLGTGAEERAIPDMTKPHAVWVAAADGLERTVMIIEQEGPWLLLLAQVVPEGVE